MATCYFAKATVCFFPNLFFGGIAGFWDFLYAYDNAVLEFGYSEENMHVIHEGSLEKDDYHLCT